MKKICVFVCILLVSAFLFAENILKDYVSDFFNKGAYIAIERNTKITYYPKHIISQVICDGDDLKIVYVDKEFDYESISFNLKKDKISIDDNFNIIIKKN